MAKKKAKIEGVDADSFINDFIKESAERGGSNKAYLADEHDQYTFGWDIPLAFQWLLGESNKLRAQTYIGVSGEKSSMKSTLICEMGNWALAQGGVHFAIDTENKTSPGMLGAMSRGFRRAEKYSSRRRAFIPVESIEGWQEECTRLLVRSRQLGQLPKGQRIATLISVDSLMARTTEEAQTKLAKEGHSEGRGYPVANAMVTNYLESITLRGTTAIFAYVQHMKEAIDSMGYGKQYREKGPSAAAFAATVHLRVKRIKSFNVVYHPARWVDGPACEGYTIQMETAKSCVGPDRRRLQVDLVWQYLDEQDENGEPVSNQYMAYDWDGALGNLLIGMKYGDKKVNSYELDRLNDHLLFTVSGKDVKCEALGLAGASTTEFGRAINTNPEVRDRISRFLRIKGYPDFQDVEIERVDE